MHLKKEAHLEHHRKSTGAKYLKSIIYGGLDGTITTFAVVAGVAGASLSSGVLLILGFANLIGDGISMAIGDYLSTKAENDYHKSERKKEEIEVKNYPQHEKKELVEIYMKKGLLRNDAVQLVRLTSKNKKVLIDTLMEEELNISKREETPLNNAFVTFFSFLLFGLIPLISYLIHFLFPDLIRNTLLITILLTAISLFLLGAFKVKITGKNWLKSGIETLIIGGLAAGAAYIVGYLMAGLAR